MPAGRPKGKASYSNADVLELVGVFTECLEHPIERLKATGDGQLLKIFDMDNPNAKDVAEPSVHKLLCQLAQKRPNGLYTKKLLAFVILCLDRRCSNLLSGCTGKQQSHWAQMEATKLRILWGYARKLWRKNAGSYDDGMGTLKSKFAVNSGAPRRQSSIAESDPFELLLGDEPIIPPFPTDNSSSDEEVALDSDEDDATDDVLGNDGVPDGSNPFEVDDCEIVGLAQPANTTPKKRQLLECLSIDSRDPPDKFARVSSQNIDTPPDTNITPEKLPQSIPNPMPLELADRQLPPKLLPAGVAKVMKRPSGSGGIVRRPAREQCRPAARVCASLSRTHSGAGH